MLLTEQEVAKISESCQGADWAYQLVRKTESALLEKLKAQEPCAVVATEPYTWKGYVGSWVPPKTEPIKTVVMLSEIPVGTKLYVNPLPPDDLVRDAERLDWLMNFGRMVICDKEGCYTYTHTSGRYGPVAKTKREAIDKAMKEMK